MRGDPASRIPDDIPRQAMIEAIPFFAQERYQCGPAAMAMALQWSGVETVPEELLPMVYTPGRKGSLQPGLVTAARRNGRLAYAITGLTSLLRETAAGRPVIVLQNLGLGWLPRWHYAVVIGYDLNLSSIVLHSGGRAARSVSLRTFLYTWQRADQWGLLVLPPGTMPVCPEAVSYLEAALGLQQAGDAGAAVKAFRAAADRWPENVAVFMALGNALYIERSLPESVRAFERAVHLDPDNGDALNNLAHLLAETGNYERAQTMARRALAAGGAHREVYLRTLREIVGAPQSLHRPAASIAIPSGSDP